ncbi:MAG: winged helix-turn-helix domain-containing protein [Acidobacteria bacterium]|nr:winged helix-turn-helix domain-containing protein [Acidobacteriota bacterium]
MQVRKGTIRFGSFELDSAAGQLRSAGQALNLTGRAFLLLEILAARPGELVTREEIRDQLWPEDHHVDFESAINVAVRRIREVLESTGDSHVYIQTIRGRGYRLDPPASVQPAIEAPPVVDALPLSSYRRQIRMGLLIAAAVLISVVVARSRLKIPVQKQIVQFSRSGSVENVAASMDGKLIAYMDSDNHERVIRLCTVEDKKCSILLRKAGDLARMEFSPDGTQLYFGSWDGPSPGANIYQLDTATGLPSLLIRGTTWLQGVSRSGSQLLFMRDQGGKSIVLVYDLAAAKETEIFRRLNPDRLTAASLSPDGNTLACWWLLTNSSGHHHSLSTVRLADHKETVLAKGPWSSVFPRPELTWDSKGESLIAVIASLESGLRQIYRVKFPSGETEKLTDDPSSYNDISLAAGSQTLVLAKNDTAPQIWTLDPAQPLKAKQITSGFPGFDHPAWTPTLILATSPDGNWSIDPFTGRKQRLPNTSVGDNRPFASLDGRAVYYESSRDGEMAIWQTPLSGGTPVKLTANISAGRPKASPDGRWLVFSGFSSDLLSIWRKPLEGGTPVRINSDASTSEPDISPDGKWIAAHKTMSMEIRIYPFEGGPVSNVLKLPVGAQQEHFSWSPDGKSLTFILTLNGVSNLWNLPVDGSPAKPLTRFETHQITDFAWSSKGMLALTRFEQASDVVLMKGYVPN